MSLNSNTLLIRWFDHRGYPDDDRHYTRCASDEAEDNIDKSGVYV